MILYLIYFIFLLIYPSSINGSLCLSKHSFEEMNQTFRQLDAIAAQASSVDVGNVFRGMGHIGEVPNETLDFAAAAVLSGVRTICEVGFNAGHSAAVFLLANPFSRYVAFDLGNLVWSIDAVNYFKQRFGDRFLYIKGDSKVKIVEFSRTNPNVVCDLWSIDGDHGDSAVEDFDAARFLSRNSVAAFVIADDHTDSFPAIKRIWHQQQTDGHLASIYCHHETRLYQGFHKGWCLGRWLMRSEFSENNRAVAREYSRIRFRLADSRSPTSCATLQSFVPRIGVSNSQEITSVIESRITRISELSELVNVSVVELAKFSSPDCKFLVYTVLSAERKFNAMAALMIRSLRSVLERRPSICMVDVLILTDEDNIVNFQRMSKEFDVKFMSIPRSFDPEKASMSKLSIFSLPNINEFRVVMFVDCDTLFDILNIDFLFVKTLNNPENLHVFAEPNASFDKEYWSLSEAKFSFDEINELDRLGIVPFNAGIFMFEPNVAMRIQFQKLNQFIQNYDGKFFYEQSFMNYWFAKQRLLSYSVDSSSYVIFPHVETNYQRIVHFTGLGRDKLSEMRTYAVRNMGWMFGTWNVTL